MEAALAAWVAAQCDRPLGQEFVKEVEAAKCRELDAGCKFPRTKVAKDMVETRWVLT